jgi:hypothetical protein
MLFAARAQPRRPRLCLPNAYSVRQRSCSPVTPTKARAHPLQVFPFSVLRVLPTVRPVGRTCSLRFFGPTTTSLGLAPHETAVTPPRFRSRAFSTPQRFTSRPELRGLVSCRCRSWAFSCRGFPSQESRAPLEAASAPLWSSTDARNAPAGSYHRRFLQTPTLARSGLDPRTTMSTLSTGARRPLLPGCPEASRDGTDNVPPASPTSKRPSPHESVRDRAGSPPLDRSLLSWASSPPEPSPSTPRSLNPPRPRGPEHRLRPESPATTQGTGSPQGQVQPSPTHTRVPVRSARRLPAPFEAGPRHPSVASPPPSASGPSGSHPPTHDPRSL